MEIPVGGYNAHWPFCSYNVLLQWKFQLQQFEANPDELFDKTSMFQPLTWQHSEETIKVVHSFHIPTQLVNLKVRIQKESHKLVVAVAHRFRDDSR